MTKTIAVSQTVLRKAQDGKRILSVSSKVGEFDLEFSAELWSRLSETAQWFEKHHVNGVAKAGQ